MIYLTTIGLTTGGSSTVHIYTQKQYREQHSSLIRKSVDREVYPGICLTSEEKHLKTSVRAAGECQLAKSIKNRAYLSIRIHKHNNKNI
jgi:cyclopropane fatty-acyl-phospholipid synthase-like methyltransferase